MAVRSIVLGEIAKLLTLALVTASALAACGDDGETTPSPSSTGGSGGSSPGGAGPGGGDGGPGGADASTTTSSTTTTGAAGASGATGSGGSGDGGGTTSSTSAATGTGGGAGSGLAELGTLVVLGDSIGDGGGQAPFYYQTLHSWLGQRYGDVAMHRNAESGSKTSALVGQIDDLPGQLAGPVAVAITSGGNDMKDALAQVVTGTDAAVLAQVGANIDAALEDLLAPGRFGAGVEVFVFEADIYDASDGEGNFGQNDCAFGGGLPALPTDGYFARWNGEIATRVTARAQVLIGMHDHFRGHGFNGDDVWFASDCTHPNAAGHGELASIFYEAITGEAPPQ